MKQNAPEILHSAGPDGDASFSEFLLETHGGVIPEAWESALKTLGGAALYHSPQWLEALRTTYGLELYFGLLRYGDEPAAALVAAQAHGRIVALPFSDYAPPLYKETPALQTLAAVLSGQGTVEIRGVGLPPPWHTSDSFELWTVELEGGVKPLERRLAPDFRTSTRRALAAHVSIEHGSTIEHLRRFYRLQLENRRRLGVPPQPFAWFMNVHRAFAATGQIEVWLATHNGADCAADVVLRHEDTVYQKWNARADKAPNGANHLLLWSLMEDYAKSCARFDLGRTDRHNQGLRRFKQAMGAQARPLPYAYCPTAPRLTSAESPGKAARVAQLLWRRLPLTVTRLVGASVYRYFA